MSAVELISRAPAIGEQRALCGWGRTARSRCRVMSARGVQDVVDALEHRVPAGAGLIARRAGRSYGDAAQNDGGDVLDMSGFDRILSVDDRPRLVTAQAGATIAQLLVRLAAHGLTLPVVPGTRHVTLGGAIASDIHGKNHHRDGGMARHVVALTLCTPADGCVEVSPEADPELFYATFGGMGLTGVVLQATVQAEPLASPWVAADVDRTDGLEQTLELMAGEERHRYSVAWLDLLAPGQKMGRAVVSQADPLAAESAPAPPSRLSRRRSAFPGSLARGAALQVPPGFPGGLLHPLAVRAFNAAYWRASPRRERGKPLALVPYFFPLD